MVKCLNGGDPTNPNRPTLRSIYDYWKIQYTPKKCDGFLKTEYLTKEVVDPRSRKVFVLVYCPICKTGPRIQAAGGGLTNVLNYDKLLEFERDFAFYIKERAQKKEEKIEKEIADKKETFILEEMIKRGFDGNESNAVLKHERRKIEKEKGKILQTIEHSERKKAYGEEEANKWLNKKKGKEEKKKATKELLKSIKVPTGTYGQYIKKSLTPIYWASGGLVLSALTTQFGFFFAAFFFGISALVPSAENIPAIKEKAEKLEKHYKDLIKNEKDPNVRNQLIEEFKAEIEMNKLILETLKDKEIKGYVRPFLWMKEVFKGIGFLILVITLLGASTVIPFSGIIGLILGFIGYFQFGGADRIPEKE